MYDVEVVFSNVGRLPTALEQAKLVKIVKEDRVRLEFDSALTHFSDRRVEIIVPEIQDKVVKCGWLKGGERTTARLRVKLNGIDSAKCTVHVLSTRGGHKKKEIVIGE